MTGIGKIIPLLTNLSFEPSAMEYCFGQRILYICAGPNSGNLSGSIIAFRIQIDEVGDEKIKVAIPGTQYVIRPLQNVTNKFVECSAHISGSALKLDKFGNLHYISKGQTAIMRISSLDINKVMNVKPRVGMKYMIFNVTSQVLYSNKTTSYIYSLNGITLEREYLYWTNNPKGTH